MTEGVATDGWKSSRADRAIALLALAVLGAVYLATAGRFVLGGDNGEFATIAATGGVAHPSGYPLYSIYLRLTSWMPGTSAAHSAALATALLGVGAVAMIRTACRSWGASCGSATTTATLLGVSPLLWKMATHAEVFALHALLAAAIVAACGPFFRVAPARRVALLGLLAGLGLCNNHSIVMIAPLGLFVAVTSARRAARPLRAVAGGLIGLAVGLLPYLYTFVVGRRSADMLSWGNTGTLSGLWAHFTRADYGTAQLAISDAGATPAAHAVRLAAHLAIELYVAPLIFVVLGFVTLLVTSSRGTPQPLAADSSEAVPLPLHRRTVRGPRPERRSRWSLPAPSVPNALGWAYLMAFLTAGPVFVALFNLPLESLALLIVERFYLLPLVLLSVPLALGMDRLFGRILAPVDVQGPVVIGVACIGLFLSYDAVREHHRPDVEQYLENSLRTAADNSVLLGTGDHRVYGFWYERYVEQNRTDVLYVDVMLLHYPWYRERIERALGFPLEGVSEDTVDTRRVAASVLARARPLYMTNRFSDGISRSFATYPIGTLIRVLPPGSRPPPPEQLEAMNVDVAIRYTYPPTDPVDPDGWAAHVQLDYTRPWQALANAYDAMGRPADAERCRNRGVIFLKH